MNAELGSFLAGLRTRLLGRPAPTTLPDAPHSALRAVGPDGNLVERFTAAATAAGCQVTCTAESGWAKAVVEILRSLGAKRVYVQPQPGAPF